MTPWPPDQIERRPLAELVPYARNARTHSDDQIAQIEASIREWGWTMPVLIDESGSIIAGHGRVLAGAKLGLSDVPVVVARGWTQAQKQAYRIADNKLSLNAGWDKQLLALEVAELEAMSFDMPLMGFSEKELARLRPAGGDAEPQLGELQYSVVVRCGSEGEQAQLLERFEREGLKCEALIS